MINEKELRIGNWVHDYTTGQNKKVGGDLLYAIDILQNGAEKDFNPILLTPSILEKARFKHDDNFQYSNTECRLTKNANGGFAFWIGEEGGFLADMYYVHQLQNLYFALNGEELEINL